MSYNGIWGEPLDSAPLGSQEPWVPALDEEELWDGELAELARSENFQKHENMTKEENMKELESKLEFVNSRTWIS